MGDAIIDDENIYMGSAICEAAKLYEQAQGAFVWLTPEACKLPLSGVSRNHHGLVRYRVPMKSGPAISTKVISPFIDTLPNSPAGRQFRDGIIHAMEGDRADIVTKRNNTVAFLDYVASTDTGPSVANAIEG